MSTEDGRYTILAIDHGLSLRSSLDPYGGEVPEERVRAVKRAVVDSLAQQCSAVLLDLGLARHLGRDWALPRGTGLIVGLDGADYDASDQPMPRLPTAEELDGAVVAGADAAKIVFYYDPERADARRRYELLCEVVVRCRSRGLPLLVEPLPLAAASEPSAWPVATVAKLAADAGADLVKLPLATGLAAEQSAEISRVLRAIPWVLLSSGLPYSQFVENLRVALEGGAAGFAAGRSIWEGMVQAPTNPAAVAEARGRLAQAVAITRELGGSGRG